MREPGVEEVDRAVAGKRARLVCAQPDELLHVVEGHTPAPRAVNRTQSGQVRRRTIRKAELREHGFQQLGRDQVFMRCHAMKCSAHFALEKQRRWHPASRHNEATQDSEGRD
jgi:hypothetical protein